MQVLRLGHCVLVRDWRGLLVWQVYTFLRTVLLPKFLESEQFVRMSSLLTLDVVNDALGEKKLVTKVEGEELPTEPINPANKATGPGHHRGDQPPPVRRARSSSSSSKRRHSKSRSRGKGGRPAPEEAAPQSSARRGSAGGLSVDAGVGAGARLEEASSSGKLREERLSDGEDVGEGAQGDKAPPEVKRTPKASQAPREKTGGGVEAGEASVLQPLTKHALPRGGAEAQAKPPPRPEVPSLAGSFKELKSLSSSAKGVEPAAAAAAGKAEGSVAVKPEVAVGKQPGSATAAANTEEASSAKMVEETIEGEEEDERTTGSVLEEEGEAEGEEEALMDEKPASARKAIEAEGGRAPAGNGSQAMGSAQASAALPTSSPRSARHGSSATTITPDASGCTAAESAATARKSSTTSSSSGPASSRTSTVGGSTPRTSGASAVEGSASGSARPSTARDSVERSSADTVQAKAEEGLKRAASDASTSRPLVGEEVAATGRRQSAGEVPERAESKHTQQGGAHTGSTLKRSGTWKLELPSSPRIMATLEDVGAAVAQVFGAGGGGGTTGQAPASPRQLSARRVEHKHSMDETEGVEGVGSRARSPRKGPNELMTLCTSLTATLNDKAALKAFFNYCALRWEACVLHAH
jgi:hypothetical protein